MRSSAAIFIGGNPSAGEMRCENDFVENSKKECNLEAAFDCRLVSHPKNALSVDRVPGDSLRIMAGSLGLFFDECASVVR
jgi:hypothetical protein